jgi:mono/diheme cytochrome c family protein
VTGTPPLPELASDAASLPAVASTRTSAFSGLLIAVLALSLLIAALVGLPALRSDPYTRSTLALSGSVDNGGRLFRLNCAGCHGLAAQGLVGPNLHGVDRRKNDRQLIQQVVSGRTPPMPRFQPEPQAMADLLAFLHSLP